MIAWVIAAIFSVVVLILLLAPVEVVAEYKEGKLSLKAYAYKLKVYTLKKKNKVSEKKTSEPEAFEKKTVSLKEKLTKFKDKYEKTVVLIKKYVSVKLVKLDVTLGTGDAATTAIAVGSMWAAVYGLLGVLGQIAFIDEHKVNISPDFSNASFLIGGKCIIKSRLVYIIIIAITILMKSESRKGKEE